MSDYQIMIGFGAAFGDLSQVASLGWARFLYGIGSLCSLGLVLFNHGHPL